jgi:hypothetical protein
MKIAVNDLLATIIILDPGNCDSIRAIGGGYDPKWSRDGQRIAFSDGAIHTASAAGGDV